MDTLKRLAALRMTPPPSSPEAEAASPRPVVPAPAQAVPQDAMQERRALEAARQHTQARVDAVLAALAPAQQQALDARAQARVTLRETELGYGMLLRLAREDLVQQEHLGFDRWARLVAQLQGHDVTAAGDAVLKACQLEAIRDEVLVVSVPTAAAKAQLTAHYLGLLEDLASTPAQRIQIQVLIR